MRLRNLAFGAIVGGLMLMVGNVSASALTYQSSTNVGFTFNPTISISLSSDLLISSLSPGSTADSNIINVAINTNASQGYVLTATAGTSSTTTNLVNNSNSSYTFTSLATNATLTDWTNASDNTWGYSYSEDNGTTWISGKDGSNQNILGYSGLPLDNNDNGETGKTLISTTLPSDNKTLKFKISAKAASSQASGDYTNTINFYAVANPEPSLGPVSCPAGKICFNANSLTPVEGVMGQKTPSSSELNSDSVTLWAPNFKNDGYGFAGWNDSYTGNGSKYGPTQDIPAPSDINTTGLSLYAMWVPSAGDMQNWNGCANLNKGDVTALKDSRDNNVYAVAKLADDKCWMIENLRLADKDANNNDIILSSANTHNPSLPLNNSWYYSNSQTTLTTSNHLSPTTTPAQTVWCGNGSSDCFDQSMLATDNTVFFINNTVSGYDGRGVNIYGYGNYYNWYSATAGHGTYSKSSGDTVGDICPAGWHLPTGGETTGEYYALNIAVNNGVTDVVAGNRLRSYPLNFVYSGQVSGNGIDSYSRHGFYWTSSPYNTLYARHFRIDYYSAVSMPLYYKSSGLAVRCIAGV